MKRLLLILAVIIAQFSYSQESYNVNGESLSLYAEAEGSLTLLWNSFDGSYRYFIKKDNEIVELTNTKKDKKFQEEYKGVLQSYTGSDASKVRFTKADLTKEVDNYNVKNDANYISEVTSVKLKTRLGAFAGITNYAYFLNPENTSLPQLGAELEIIDEVKLKRHSLAVQLRHIIGNNDFDFSSTQVSLNYRFKFIKCQSFDIYVNTKIADYVHISQDINVAPDLKIAASGGEFQAPFALGLGGDIALGNGYLTLLYQDIFALNLNDNGEFPLDFVIGYKWNL